jgi:hypothetical protein
VPVGAISCISDEGYILEQTDGSAWGPYSPTTGNRIVTFGITIDGGGDALTPGVKGFWPCPVTGTLLSWTLLSTDAAATAGSLVIDVWKDVFANYPPTDADSITAGSPPTLSSDNATTNSTLSGWTVAVAAGDVFGFNVDSTSGITRATLQLVLLVA